MLRMLLCLLLASLLKTGAAQTPQTEINEQVWKQKRQVSGKY